MGALNDTMLKILIFCSVVDLVVSMIFESHERETAWIEGVSIMMAVIIVSGVTSITDYRKESQFIQLNKFSDSKNLITVK